MRQRRWWPWSRRRAIEREPYQRIPDYDTVFPPGHPNHRPCWADLAYPASVAPETALRAALDEPTAVYRTLRVPPWLA